MVEISIIVPIYNVEKYLSNCIESILAQTLKNFELILIDDGSPDNCGEIMEAYAKTDKRIITIHQKNKGVSAARNAGLKIAKGIYVSFIDPDDYVSETYLEELVAVIESTGTEIACCNWDYFYSDGSRIVHNVKNIPMVMGQQEFVSHLFDNPRTLGGSNWNKLFIREKIEHLYDEELQICEDNLFLIKYCLNINSGCYIDKALYHVFEREDSATRKDSRKIVFGLSVRNRIIRITKNIHPEVEKLAEKDFLDSCYWFCNQHQKEKQGKYFWHAYNLFSTYIRENFIKITLNNKIYWKTKILYILTVCNKGRNFR